MIFSSLRSSSNLYKLDPFLLGSSSYNFFLVSSSSCLFKNTRLSSSFNMCWLFKNCGVLTNLLSTFYYFYFISSDFCSSFKCSLSWLLSNPVMLAVAWILRPTLSAPYAMALAPNLRYPPAIEPVNFTLCVKFDLRPLNSSLLRYAAPA